MTAAAAAARLVSGRLHLRVAAEPLEHPAVVGDAGELLADLRYVYYIIVYDIVLIEGSGIYWVQRTRQCGEGRGGREERE